MAILTGTASWTDPTLVRSGRFYPPDARTPEERLRFYAAQFPMVEVDSSYYGMPSADNALRWVERTPDDFTFDIKAFRAFTLHKTPLKAIPSGVRDEVEPLADEKGSVRWEAMPHGVREQLWSAFEDGIRSIKDAGKLGYVLFQLPPWVMRREGNLKHLAECAGRLEGYTLAVEFRHRSWMDDGNRSEVLAFLREQNLPMVIVDEPQGFPNSIPTAWEVTSPDLAVVRFHGRNRQTWAKRKITAAERFNYLYAEDELRSFLDPVRRVAEQARDVHAVFNNCYEDKAVVNARQFMDMLRA